ncbi:hypothetical protein BC830DRAFT_1100594 [Chytriomyces sp. MP71]|nr:hypothetical protein BC830DRAFT_1100594 [Chytriomyces sp. MP71]
MNATLISTLTGTDAVLQSTSIGIMSTVSVVGVCELAWFLHFIVKVEVIDMGKPLTVKAVFTPVNAIFMCGAFSMGGLYMSMIIFVARSPLSTFVTSPHNTINQFFMGLSEIVNVFYSFLRCQGIIRLILPTWHSHVATAVKVFPVFALLPVLTGIIFLFFRERVGVSLAIGLDNFALVLMGTVTAVFDSFLLYCLVAFLQRTVAPGIPVNKRFQVIAVRGIVCIGIASTMIGLYLYGMVQKSPTVYAFTMVLIYAMLNFIAITLLSMKHSLHQVTLEEIAESERRRAPLTNEPEKGKLKVDKSETRQFRHSETLV